MIDHFAEWFEVPLVCIDMETSGRSPAHDDRIVEIAVVRIERLQIVKTWQTYLNPDRPIPDDASRVHGIYDEDVALAPRFRDKADEFLAVCAGAMPCAYNESFDRGFAMAELWHAGKHNTELLAWPVWLDVLAWVRSVDRFVKNDDGSKVSNALGAACARRGIDTPGAHGALADATAAALLLASIAHDMHRSTASELLRRQKLLSAAHDRRYEAKNGARR